MKSEDIEQLKEKVGHALEGARLDLERIEFLELGQAPGLHRGEREQNMKATLEPLNTTDDPHPLGPRGMTNILIVDDKSHGIHLIFRHSKGSPSSREMDAAWSDDWEVVAEARQYAVERGYYESEFALKVAKLIVTAINDLPVLLTENRRLREMRTALNAYLEHPSTDGADVRRQMRERLEQLVKIQPEEI